MKLSLAWIFDHIKISRLERNKFFNKTKVIDLVKKFNNTVAEIEDFTEINLNSKDLVLVNIIKKNKSNIIGESLELKKEIKLSFRSDAKLNNIYLIKKNKTKWEWVSLLDLNSSKDGLLTSLSCNGKLLAGDWKKDFDFKDYILEIDNKSITHRPDLWGHRGIAREIAAIYNLKLKDINSLVSKLNINKVKTGLKSVSACNKFATYFIQDIKNQSSLLDMAFKLAKTDNRPIDLLVDLTNFVMLDISQPMHAFDSDDLVDNKIDVRFAKKNEKLELLDKQKITLDNKNLVITSNSKAISLAGIMGGVNTGVSNKTKNILLESANFNNANIRLTAQKFKLRTEASIRFEKGLDPEQNVLAIERYVKLLKDNKVKFTGAKLVNSLGLNSKTRVIKFNQEFINEKLGEKISPSFIKKILEKLGFGVEQKKDNYLITVPNYRSEKDISIPEDILEEIARYYGYDKISQELPAKLMIPDGNKKIYGLRKIKELLAFGSNMHEVQNYPFYDEKFLDKLNYKLSKNNYIEVQSPVSENWRKLVTSLVPHLLKNIEQNVYSGYQKLNFFEANKTWNLELNSKKNNYEKFNLAGIFYNTKLKQDFYDNKLELEKLFKLLDINIIWQSFDSKNQYNKNLPWLDNNFSADLYYKKIKIGYAGNLNLEFLKNIIKPEGLGSGFVFELDLDYLLNYQEPEVKFKALNKYQSTNIDISLFVKLKVKVIDIINEIKSASKLISKVELIDSFSDKNWQDKKSLTFRYNISKNNRNLLKQDISEVGDSVLKKIKKIAIEVR